MFSKMEEHIFSTVFNTCGFSEQIILDKHSEIWAKISGREDFCRKYVSRKCIWTHNPQNLIAICIIYGYDRNLFERLVEALHVAQISVMTFFEPSVDIYIYESGSISWRFRAVMSRNQLMRNLSRLNFSDIDGGISRYNKNEIAN